MNDAEPTGGTGADAGTVPPPGALLLDKYRIERTVGSGGMATVLCATHLKLHERVAIKLPHFALTHSPRAVERFLQEARVSSRLRGEHATRVFDIGALADGRPYIVMEYLAGADLRSLLARRGPVPPATAVDYILQACEAVAEAHALGVVHCDIKPANLFLTRRVDGTGCIKVLDFGISKMLDASQFAADLDETAPGSDREGSARRAPAPQGELDLLRTRGILGSPRYMAPEQIKSPAALDARVDLWALGVVLFELLEGRPPFAENDAERLREAIAHSPLPPFKAEGVSESLAAVVRRCMAKDPSGRFADVHDLAVALVPFGPRNATAFAARIGRVLRGAGAEPAEEHGTTADLFGIGGASRTESEVGPTPRKRRIRTALRVAAGLTLAGVLAGFIFSQSSTRSEMPVARALQAPPAIVASAPPLVLTPAESAVVAPAPPPVAAFAATAAPPPARHTKVSAAAARPAERSGAKGPRSVAPTEKGSAALFDTPD